LYVTDVCAEEPPNDMPIVRVLGGFFVLVQLEHGGGRQGYTAGMFLPNWNIFHRSMKVTSFRLA
jgi:hypothetical protein